MKKKSAGHILYRNLIDFGALSLLLIIIGLHCSGGLDIYKQTLAVFWGLISLETWQISPYFFASILVTLTIITLVSLLFASVIREFIIGFKPNINKKRALIILTIWLFWILTGVVFSTTR